MQSAAEEIEVVEDEATCLSTIPRHGACPPPLYSSAAVAVGTGIFVFGGSLTLSEDDRTLCQDTYRYDVDDGFWSKFSLSIDQPCARAGHCMVTDGSCFYVMCGWKWGKKDVIYLGDCFRCSISDMQWTAVKASGNPPVPRAHAAAAYSRRKVLLFGGSNGTLAANYRNDVVILDLDTSTWTTLQTVNAPPGRSHHSMVLYGGKCFVFGGMNLRAGKKHCLGDFQSLDLASGEWTDLQSEHSSLPDARYWGSMVVMKDRIAVVGGCNMEGRFFDDAWFYDPVSKVWKRLKEKVEASTNKFLELPAVGASAVCAMENLHLVYIGGVNSKSSSDSTPLGSKLADHSTKPMSSASRLVIVKDNYVLDLRAWKRYFLEHSRPHGIKDKDFMDRALNAPMRSMWMTRRRSNMSTVTVESSLSVASMAAKEEDQSVMVWHLGKSEGSQPAPRSGHAVSSVGNRMYVYGGVVERSGEKVYSSDLFVLDVSSLKWNEVRLSETSPYVPAGRAGHSMHNIEQGRNQLLVLFGWNVKDGKAAFLDDTFTLDPLSGESKRFETKGEGPQGRSYAATLLYRSKIFLFGGCTGNFATNYKNDLWTLDLLLGIWTKVVPTAEVSLPVGRSQHSMLQYGGKIYVFGGNNKAEGQRNYLADLWTFDLAKSHWKQIRVDAEMGPTARAGHGMAMYNAGIFVFGGGGMQNGEEGFYDSMWVFDTASNVWHLLRQEDEHGLIGSKRPCARAGHSMQSVGHSLVVFGGVCPGGAGVGGELRGLNDVSILNVTSWRHAVPKLLIEREREQATRLLSKIQGLDNHAANRLLESMQSFQGASREAYTQALEDVYGEYEDATVVAGKEEEEEDTVKLDPMVSASLFVINQKIDRMLARVAPERQLVYQLQRTSLISPIVAKGAKLRITVVGGKGLPKMDRFGKADPYVVLDVDGQKAKTRILKKTLDPVWEETFDFYVRSFDSNILVECFDWDFADSHDFMGCVEVDMNSLLEGDVDQYFSLRKRTGELLKGSLHLRLQFENIESGLTDLKASVMLAMKSLNAQDKEAVLANFSRSAEEDAAVRQQASLAQVDRAVAHEVQSPLEREKALGGKGESKARVETRRQENLAEIERLRRQQLEEEEIEAKERELKLLSEREDDLRAARKHQQKRKQLEAAISQKVRAIAELEGQGFLQERGDQVEAGGPRQQAEQLPAARNEGVEVGWGGSEAVSASSTASKETKSDEEGRRRSLLTTMLGKSSSVEAKRKMMQSLMSKRKANSRVSPDLEQDEFQKEVEAVREKLEQQKEAERVERRRQEKLEELELQRQQVMLKMDEEKARIAKLAEKRELILRSKEDMEQREEEVVEQRRQEVDRKRAWNLTKLLGTSTSRAKSKLVYTNST
mmetsp:Transcript_17781/g.40242  ORF Transcript_17781/g.40242 Transcript_17781/m.40242 type:complete len:1378 (-) Transcript_17781:1476-5609(-)